MATAEKLGKIATDIVLDKVTQDKIHLASRNEEKIRRQKESEDGDQAFTTQDGEEESDLSSQTETLDDLSHWREKRMQQIKAAREKEEVYRQQGHGSYEEIIEEEFLPTVTKSENAVCHFFNSTFERCKVMDKHLHQLALLHMETKFVKLNAEKAPFFTSKLNIRCLPSVVLFKNGVAVYTLVGFQALGGVDDFPTSRLEKLLLKHRVATKLPGRELSDNEGGSSEDDE